MKHVLFVDDETSVLRGLRRLLHTRASDWRQTFCDSAEEALAVLESDPVDVVVSDLQMPAMDGVTFLGLVRERFPSVVRLILSGHAEPAVVLQSTSVAHQFLGKPCDPDSLQRAISRCCAIRDVMAEKRLQELASNLDTIPLLPETYTRMVAALQESNTSLEDIGAIASRDVGLTAKILQLVNSSFFGLRQEITRAEQAASFLGVETLKSLALSVQVFSSFDLPDSGPWSLESFQEHGLRVGACARTIAELEGLTGVSLDRAYLAGILHDFGELVFATGASEEFANSRKIADKLCIPRHEMERRLVGASHAVLGGYILGIWGLPIDVVDAVLHHHKPQSSGAADVFTVTTAVHVADAMAHGVEGGSGPSVCSEHITGLGLEHRLPAWREACEPHLSSEVPS